jgi:uncharacterized membrane protein
LQEASTECRNCVHPGTYCTFAVLVFISELLMLVLATSVLVLVTYHANSHTVLEGCNRHEEMKAAFNMYGGYAPLFISVYLSTNLRNRKRYEIKYIATTFHYTTLYFQITKKFFLSESNITQRIFFSFNLSTIYCF